MAAPAITLAPTADEPTSNPITAADDTTSTAPLKERAWALYCQGHRSPAISARLRVSERTVRSWISRIEHDLDAHHAEQRHRHLLLAIERRRQIATTAWDGYERAIALSDAENTHAVEANDEAISTACIRASRNALTTAARYLSLIASNDRELTSLSTLYDHQSRQREDAAREQEYLAEREREHQAREWEHLAREEARRDRAKEREREPRPPFGLDPATLAPQRSQEPATRLPEVNAYFAAYDTYHAARAAADTYTAVLARAAEDRPTDRDAEDYLVQSAFSLRQPQRPPQRPPQRQPQRQPERQQSASLLAALTPADIAALTARLDAEEAEADKEAADAADAAADTIEIAAKTATSGSPSPRRGQPRERTCARGVGRESDGAAAERSGGGWGERSEIAAKTATPLPNPRRRVSRRNAMQPAVLTAGAAIPGASTARAPHHHRRVRLRHIPPFPKKEGG